MVVKHINKAVTVTENILNNGRKELFNVYKTIKERKFNGNEGLVIKNSFFQLMNSSVAKIGSFLYTIIIARLLMPELFGLYSLALATIIVFSAFSDLGIGMTLVKFVSEALGNKDEKTAKKYAIYLIKLKCILLITSAVILGLLSKFISTDYYNKPIFLALLVGGFYILISGGIGILDSLLQANNKFKQSMIKESIYQLVRLILVPSVIIFSISKYPNEFSVMLIIIALTLSFLIAGLYLYFKVKKEVRFFRAKRENIESKEKRHINKFLILVSTTILSGIFLGYVDTIMLGSFVSSEYIGYYQAALTLVGSIFPLIPLSGVLLPIFSRLKGQKLEKGFSRSLRFTLFISTILFIAAVIFSDLAIWIVYGHHYQLAGLILKILAINIFFIPISSLYDSYFVSIGKPQIMAKYLIISTIINIVLNYVLIKTLIVHSEYYAIIGSACAVVISRIFYLTMQIINKK